MTATMPRIPVILVTGFLGSGKTTLLNKLLLHPGMADSAVIVNEFGEISIDHLIIETAIENTIVLESGCICCTVRGDLVDTLRDLKQQYERGAIPAFSRVLIETTGLAEPAPIIQMLVSDPMLTDEFQLGLVVVTVDAQHGLEEIRRFHEAIDQIAAADILLVTKTDLVAGGVTETLTETISSINPTAIRQPIVDGKLDPAWLLSFVSSSDDEQVVLQRWNNVLATFGLSHEHESQDDHGHGDHDGGSHSHHFHGSTSGIETFSIELEEPVPADSFTDWLESLLSLRGADVLRVKGILALQGRDSPVLIQCVQHTVYPPQTLSHWSDVPRRTQLVFITRGISRLSVEESLAAALRDKTIN
jgi:G3E family GTPase